MPEVVARVGVDLDPVDVTDADDARWLRACLWPDQPERAARLEAEMALAATAPPLLLHGDAVEVVADAVARVPTDALPVVTTTWALSQFPLERRLRLLHRLDHAAAGRAVAWVSAEGVGVAPTIPTLGDRRASGHSIIGLAVFDRSALHAEAIGRCWAKGRLLAWLHPGNVVLTASGPMVIDWPNAARGDGSADVAYTWVILTTSRLEGSLLHRLMLATGRRLFAAAFLAGFDRRAVFGQLPVVVRARLADRYVLDEERVRLRRLLAVASHRPPV